MAWNHGIELRFDTRLGDESLYILYFHAVYLVFYFPKNFPTNITLCTDFNLNKGKKNSTTVI